MEGLINKMKTLFIFLRNLKMLIGWVNKSFPSRKSFGFIDKSTVIGYPMTIGYPQQIYLEEQTNIRYGLNIINSKSEKVIVKKYTVIAPLCTIITNSHCSTVGVPQFILGESHINDKSGDVVINEDVWLGANTTLLAGVTIGRGAIVGANALVCKNVPPYALVVGIPARIVGVKFSKEGILKHESILYSETERMLESEIDTLFAKYYDGKKEFGVEDALSPQDIDAVNLVKKIHGLN